MKKKAFIRLLKKEAEKIPKEEYLVLNKLYKPMFQDAEGILHSEQAEEEETQRRKVYTVVEKGIVNHGRRVKKLFKKHGMPAVDAYFFVKGGMVQQNRLKPDKDII